MADQPPVHPVPTMQGAFEESMMETLNEDSGRYSEERAAKVDSLTRRKLLLEQAEYQRTCAGRWKQKPGEKFHPLWKLVAQISFGMHLLQQELAKSDEEVIKILQTHVDEVDGFLERTTEDFVLAQNDIDERIRYLRLPLEHPQVFDAMLEDRSFRMSIVEGNEKIEHIVDRTAAAMNDALKDVQKGLDATRELAKYLKRLDKTWEVRSEEHESVYLAMVGNTKGWNRAFLELQLKGNSLGVALVQLGGIVAEMQRRAGVASRKNLTASKSIQGKYYIEPDSHVMRHAYPSPPVTPSKPLPQAPDTLKKAVQATLTQKYPQRQMREKHSREEVHAERQERQPRTVARRDSFSERTRSLTRRLSFFRDQQGKNNASISNRPIQQHVSDDLTSAQPGDIASSSGRHSRPQSHGSDFERPRTTSGPVQHTLSATKEKNSPTMYDLPLRKYQSHDTLKPSSRPAQRQTAALVPPIRTSSVRSPTTAAPLPQPAVTPGSTNSSATSSSPSTIPSPSHIEPSSPPTSDERPREIPPPLTLPTRASSKIRVPNEPMSFTNPTSSSALIEFLAATPPPSTPLHLSLTFGPDTSSTPTIRRYKASPPASPAPPAPGGAAMVERFLVEEGPLEKTSKRKEGRLSWKRVLGGGKKKKVQGEVFHGLDEKGEWIYRKGSR
ncbi:MAG: hypothetical protein M1830_001920 [Pleopsidium flavum]|nr:MAG: hypothetical protein M1830_001920 [Pleopsidium flavum]